MRIATSLDEIIGYAPTSSLSATANPLLPAQSSTLTPARRNMN
jgi:hypothetical protein